MSVPFIPERDQLQALTDLLESIALEETALAHFVNAEAEKIQHLGALMAAGSITPSEALDLQQSVAKVMQVGIKMQMLLQFKLENVLDAKLRLELP